MLMLERGSDDKLSELRPVKTIPSHFSPVYEATSDDFALVFGQEDASDPTNNYFNIAALRNEKIAESNFLKIIDE